MVPDLPKPRMWHALHFNSQSKEKDSPRPNRAITVLVSVKRGYNFLKDHTGISLKLRKNKNVTTITYRTLDISWAITFLYYLATIIQEEEDCLEYLLPCFTSPLTLEISTGSKVLQSALKTDVLCSPLTFHDPLYSTAQTHCGWIRFGAATCLTSGLSDRACGHS